MEYRLCLLAQMLLLSLPFPFQEIASSFQLIIEDACYTDKKKIKFSSYIGKFRVEELLIDI